MSKNQTLIINSFDRDTATYPNSTLFRIYLNAIKPDVKRIRLGSAIIRNTQFNFDSFTIGGRQLTNNVVSWFEGATPVSITIPPGSYSGTTLTATISALMTAATTVGNVYTATIDPLTGFMSFAAVGSPYGFDFTGSDSAYYQLGGLQQVYPQGVGVFTFGRPVDLSGSPYVMIKIANMQSNAFNTSNDSAAFYVPFNTQTGNLVYYEPQNIEQTAFNLVNTSLTYLDIALVDDYANPVNLNGSEWVFSLILDY